MATWETEEHKIVHEYETERAEGDAAVGLRVDSQHHTSADVPTSGGGIGGDAGYASRQASHYESAHARHGQLEATHGNQDLGPFTPSNGMHRTGHDHIDVFSRSIRMSGGVRQGPQWTSDPGSGIARAAINGNNAYKDIEVQKQGAGDTFEARQHRRWSGRGG